MGNHPSKVKDDEHPWFSIILWLGDSLPSGMVLQYNTDDIKAHIFQLCREKSVLIDKIINLADIETDIAAYFNDTDALEEDIDVRELFPIVDMASSLLDIVPNLSVIRFSLVPERVSEEVFWGRFFSLLRTEVISTIVVSN